ncbi:hypothetical protein OG625_16655 [Streptomyces sp. NBC_01351]|uniref:hypothetical protein n=1 Tax=Streptomyces sp. NBC_01351 TaxID=2903833 RepID=UPI002E3145AA|nr:hypothetical protein [Streptomyces sp. NBC_01351]
MADFFQCLAEKGLPVRGSASGIPLLDWDKADPAKVKEAEAACEGRRPAAPLDPALLAQSQALTACMRAGGFANFPDPDPRTGDHALEGLGLKESPEAYEAMKKCSGRS